MRTFAYARKHGRTFSACHSVSRSVANTGPSRACGSSTATVRRRSQGILRKHFVGSTPRLVEVKENYLILCVGHPREGFQDPQHPDASTGYERQTIMPSRRNALTTCLVESQSFLSVFRHSPHTCRKRDDLDSFQFRAQNPFLEPFKDVLAE